MEEIKDKFLRGVNMTYYIYLFLCMLNGFVLGTANLNFKTWQFWVSIICVAAAYICGAEKRE